MSIEFTKDNMNTFFKELGKEFRKLNGTKMRVEIVLIGGGAILANYGFREMTTDMDAIIRSSSVMKEAILRVSDKFGLPNDWLNTDFKRTCSYSDKLEEVSIYYKTFSNILEVRTVAAEYLIAMKLMSGRQYKNDLSDIAGILWEHKKNNNPINKDRIINALLKLYGQVTLPDISRQLLDDIFEVNDFESAYIKFRESEIEAKSILLEFDRENPGDLKGESINQIIEIIRQRKEASTANYPSS
jgi:hypothetical protein